MRGRYIRQIMRRLRCSGARKREIRRQLTSEILAELDEGKDGTEILKRMGDPKEIAAEFNSSFSELEKRKGRREKWGKILLAAAVILLLLGIVLYWIVPKTKPLEESRTFDEAAVREQAEEIVRLLNADDYPALQQLSTENMKAVLTKEKMEQAKKNFAADWGAFQSFGNCYVAEVEQQGERFAVVQMGASYENTSVTYTISFDEEMALAGLYMK